MRATRRGWQGASAERDAWVSTGLPERVGESVRNPSPSYRLLGKVRGRRIRPGGQIINDALEIHYCVNKV